MQLSTSTWQEVETYLQRATGIIIPIGSHEQHGPNGLVGTDAICPEVVAKGAGGETGAMVGPTQAIGMAQHHLAFAGSITLRPSTLIAVIHDTVESLARHGFDHIYFLNGHGGNISTVNAAFNEVYSDYSLGRTNGTAPVLRLANWFAGKRVMELTEQLYGRDNGSHATTAEVSLTYFAHPEHVKKVEMHPRVAPDGPIRDAADFRKRFPDGRMGSDPSLANPGDGEKLFRAAVADTVEDYRAFLKE